eukprot:gene13001-13130_t
MATAPVAAASSLGISGNSALWMQHRAYDAAVDFSKADPHYTTKGLPTWEIIRGNNISLAYHTGYSYGNVALVRFGMQFYMVVRKSHWSAASRSSLPWYPPAHPHQDDRIRFWHNAVALCSVNSNTLQPTHCHDYDPRDWPECWWGQGFEAGGIEDPRLFAWPGKGLYMLFGSKPWPRKAESSSFEDQLCEGPLALQQWLVLVEPSAHSSSTDHWQQGIIRLQYTDDTQNIAGDGLRREKNWNPFVYRNRLLFSQTLSPHVVVRCSSSGQCKKQFRTSSLAFEGLPNKPRGNTPAVLVPAAFSNEPLDYYLGIAHVEANRSYTSFFYKMQARPPFRIYARSRPIPLLGSKNPWNPAWADVSFPMSLDLINDLYRVVIGYGSGDTVPRVLTLAWSEVRDLFPRREANRPMQPNMEAVGVAATDPHVPTT